MIQQSLKLHHSRLKKNLFRTATGTILIFVLMLNLLGCDHQTNSPTTTGHPETKSKLTVVTTIFPLADITRNLGGPYLHVLSLLPPGSNPHTYEPTPGQMKEVAQAQLIIRVGAGLDNWVDKLAASSHKEARSLEVSEGVPLLNPESESTIEHEPTAGHDDPNDASAHHHEGADPHIWLDPVLVRDHIAPAITNTLIEIDPIHEADYRSYLVSYQAELTKLHQEYEKTLAPITHRKYISFHSSWCYLAQRYHLNEVASIEPYPGKEPSAKWVKEVVDLAKEHHIKVIFAEPQFNPKTAEVISREFGGQVMLLDPLGGDQVEQRATYLDLMRYNLTVLQNGLNKGD